MRAVRAGAAVGFSTFAEFLERTADDDRQFLAEDELGRFPQAACGMANGAGGWIVLGASPGGDDLDEPVVSGVRDPSALERRLARDLAEGFSSRVGASFAALSVPAPLLLVCVRPSEWYDRPVCVGRDYLRGVYRRVEGVDLISGLGSRFRLGMDALERLRDDRPAKGTAALHEESVAGFRAAVTERRPEWAHLSTPAFLSRTLVLSSEGDEQAVTEAGNYLLGDGGVLVRAELQGGANAAAFEVRNLWRAWADLLPRLTRSLSSACAAAFRECFVNALLHADYDAGGVTVRLAGSPASARFENPGLVRTWRAGESACRNFRLMRMFQMFGAASGEGRGLRAIRRYQPDFELEQDGLELTTAATLRLEPRAGLQDVPPAI